MQLICAVVRPERAHGVVKALENGGYNAFSEWGITGRGRQRGIQVGPVMKKCLKECYTSSFETKKKTKSSTLSCTVPALAKTDVLGTARFSSSPLPNPIQLAMIFNRQSLRKERVL